MNKVLIRDVCFAHGESSCHERKPQNFIWTREDFGSDVSQSLFENFDDITASTIKDQIQRSIVNFEDRVNLREVKVLADFDGNAFDVIIRYDIVGADIPPQELQFVLQSNR